jgi:ABC-2 type transport system permease protein
MKQILGAFFGTYLRNMALLRRQRTLVIQAIIVPAAMLLLSAMVYGGVGDSYPIALVDQSKSAQSRNLANQLTTERSDIGNWFQVVEYDYDKARSDLAWGRLNMIVVIPPDFDTRHQLDLQQFNVNSDAMKNTDGRVQLVLNHVSVPGEKVSILNHQISQKPKDVARAAYLGGSSILLALFFGAMLVASNLFLLEREGNTRKEILLTPRHPAVAGFANVASACVVGMVLSLIPLGLSYWIAQFTVDFGRVLLVYLAMIPVMITCAGIGVFASYWLKYFRAAQPVITLGAIMTFFVAGGFTMVAFLQPVARGFSEWWPFSRIFTWMNPYLHGFTALTIGQIALLCGAAVIGLGLVWWTYELERRRGAQL